MNNLLLLKILHIFNDGYQASFLLLLPFIAKDLHISLTQIGTLGSLIYMMETVLALPAGHLGIRFDGMRVLITLLAVISLGFILLIFVSSFFWLFLPFILVGTAIGLFHPIAFALVAKWAEKHTRGRNLGDFTAIGDLGRIALPAIITYLAVRFGWKSTAFLYGIIAFIAFSILMFIYHRRKVNQIKEELIPDLVKFIDLIKNKRFMLAELTSVFDNISSSSLYIFLPFLFIHKGIDPAVIGSFAAAYFIGNFLGKSTIGRLTDRYGSVKIFIIGEIFMAVAIFLLATSSNLVLIVVFSIILGALTKGTIPARTAMVIESVEHHGRFEKAVSLNAFIVSLGGSLAPTMYGRVADTWGIVNSFYLAAIIAVLATLPAIVFRKWK